jgi:hypothetical protein
MGHDISVYKRVKHLRRNMWSEDIKLVYEALGKAERNAVVSGDGSHGYFNRGELIQAQDRLVEAGADQEYIDFIGAAIQAAEESDSGVKIHFG